MEKDSLSDSQVPLMEHDEVGEGIVRRQRPYSWRQIASWITALIAYTTLVVFVTRSTIHLPHSMSINFPRYDAFKYEERPFVTDMMSKFTGEPSEESDAAWHELVKNDNIYVPNSILRERGQRSVEIAGTDNSIAQLSVFHALHCLKKIRQLLHKDYYYPNATEFDEWFNSKHVDHCFEYVREYTMCHADTSIVSFFWINGTFGNGPLLPSNKDDSKHQCTNWESINSWAGQRRFDLFEIEKLRYPDNGLEYSD